MCHVRHHPRQRRPLAVSPPRDVRISDAERERALTRLGDHAAEGRLTADDLDQRTDAALAARTHAELEPLFADLPRGAGRDRTRRGRGLRPDQVWLAAGAVGGAVWALNGLGVV